MTTLTEAIVARLKAAGATHLYGVPGGECNLDFIAAAGKLGVRFVLTRNETCAALMACVSAELAGGVGAAMTTRGPGIAQAVNGAAYAYLDRAPLVLIADGYEDDQPHVSHQRLDQEAMLAPITKAVSGLRADDPMAELEDLLAQAQSIPPGPVYIEVRGARIRATCNGAVPARPPAKPPAPDREALAMARAMIGKAKKPLLLVGLQARKREAAAAVRAFVAKTGCPGLTTYKAKGVLDDHDPLTLGHYIGGVAEEAAIRAADLLLLYGFDPVEGPPQPWRYDGQAAIELSEHPFEHPLMQPDVSVYGDLSDALASLAADIAPAWSTGELAAFKQAITNAVRVETGAGVSPQHVIDAAFAAAPKEARIVLDAGAFMLPVLHLWKTATPNQSLISRGLSTMGFALPAAIASCLVDPARRAIAFTGDGGMMMMLGELGTAVQEGVAPVVVVFNDSSLTLIGAKQKRRQLAHAGVDFSDTNFAEVARGFGWKAHRVDTTEGLAPAFSAAFAETKLPTLIDVRINPEEYDAQILALRG